MYIKKTVQRNKNGKERVYLQLAESYRVGDKVKQRIICTLGRLDKLCEGHDIENIFRGLSEILSEEKGEHLVRIDDLSVNYAYEYGMSYVLKKIWDKTGLRNILKEEFNKKETLDESQTEKKVEAIFEMILNRLTDPQSKLSTMTHWRKNYYLNVDREGKKEEKEEGDLIVNPDHIAQPPLTVNDYYRAMDTLSETIEGIEESLFYEENTLFSTPEVVFFDTTSTYFEGTDADIGEYGLSKDHRGDRKQVVISLVLNEKNSPIFHKIWEGNTVDKKAFRETVKELKERFRIKRAILIADRGCVSRDIRESIEENGLEYIIGMKMNELDVKEALRNEDEFTQIDENLYVKEVILDKKKEADEDNSNPDTHNHDKSQRYIICFNPLEATHDRETRMTAISKLRNMSNVKSLIHNRVYKQLITVDKGKTIKINEAKIKELEEYDGKWVLLTNTTLKTEEVAQRYKELWKIERSFRDIKTFFKIRPIYHYRERRIRAHIAIVFLSLYSERVMENMLGMGWNFQRIKDALTPLKLAHIESNGMTYLIRTELQQETKSLIRGLHIQFPERIIYLNTSNKQSDRLID